MLRPGDYTPPIVDLSVGKLVDFRPRTLTTNSILGHGPLVSEHTQIPLTAGKLQTPRYDTIASGCLGATYGLFLNSTAKLLTSSSYGASNGVVNTQPIVGPGFPSVVGTSTGLPPTRHLWPGPVGLHPGGLVDPPIAYGTDMTGHPTASRTMTYNE